jgi:GT2 family glycosyltransferase
VAAIGAALAKYDFVASRFEPSKLNAAWIPRTIRCPQQEGLQMYWYPSFLPHAGGCGLGVKHSLYKAVGGFDETILVLDDTDFCFKIQLAGATLHFVPDATIHIRYRPTLAGMYHQARVWGKQNVLVYKKYRPLGMPKLSWKEGMKAWWDLLWRLPQIRSKDAFGRWLWRLAWRTGRLLGCIEYRVLAP